ncbi:MAG TPA: DUF6544 family protein [Anaerolineaceae bacterium]|nr:DUF6544 family protein [Anaerolineaceae bacterium]
MKPLIILLAVLIGLFVLIVVGLKIKPAAFPPYPQQSQAMETVPLPADLPAPVERFYHTVYGERVPVVKSVVATGRAIVRAIANVALPARFVFVYTPGKNYRHYFEATIFGLPIMKVNEGYLDGKSFFESPMGTYHDDPNNNQAADLGLWAESGWFPAIYVTDPRVRWEPVDDHTALLRVPFEDKSETFTVRFDPETGLIDVMEAMRYRNPGDKAKILWITQGKGDQTLPGSPIQASGSATWLDQGTPWAEFTIEEIRYNVDVSDYIYSRGQ